MGWFSDLGKKISTGVSTLGKKVVSGVRAGVKYGITHSEKIGNIANKVSGIAEKVGDVALLGAGVTASMGLEPVAGVLGAVGGVSKGVMKGADAVGKVANKVTETKQNLARFGIDANELANRYI